VDAAPDQDNGAPSSTYPAFKPDVPQLVDFGGPLVSHPKIVPIFFPNDPYAAQLQQFVDTLGATPFYQANTQEWGIAAATGEQGVQLTETAPPSISDSQIQTWLLGKLSGAASGDAGVDSGTDGGDPVFPPPDGDTVYVVYYPAGTTITFGGGQRQSQGTSCQDFGGYHSDFAFGSQFVSYAVIPRCSSFGPLQGFDVVTGASSHEILEAVTDPYPQDNPAYAQVDDAHLFWVFLLGGGENGDMCAQFPDSFYKPVGYDFTVQRCWSNVLSRAGHDPCAPQLPGEVYFNSMPVLPDKVALDLGGGQSVTTEAVKIPVGQSRTIDVDLFSDGPTSGPWSLEARDDAQLMGGSPNLQLAFDRQSGVNGEKLHLTIKVLSASQFNAEGFWIFSTLGSQMKIWLGLVTN
jgi:hypothetical protein